MTDVLNLDATTASSLAARYVELRATRVAEARRALDQDPPDVERVFDAAKELFADEDELVESVAGTAGLTEWRTHELESRTVILAILASWSNKAWDAELEW